jgi:mRNA-degrading endonuclease HigB of HigAB toxin-antitoxin module
LYSAYYDAERDLHKVVIEWIGGHKAYDELFGYSS